MSRQPLESRLWRRVATGPGCWPWTGAVLQNGYGQIGKGGRAGKLLFVHRLAYELHKGPIPDGLQIDHLCRNRRCCNPAHLEAVTPQENTLRGNGLAAQRARQKTCLRGHPFTINQRGKRVCKTCCQMREQRKRNRDHR